MKKMLTICTTAMLCLNINAQRYSTFTGGAGSDITPEGWLREFLSRQKSGMTGHPEALSYPFDSCLWNGEIGRNTETYGSDWWRYEQTAYYTDGLLRLGYLINDEEMVEKAVAGINYTLDHVSEKGVLGNKQIESMWPMCVYFRVMQAYYEHSHDERIIEALHRHYLNFTREQIGNWRNIVSIEGMLWTYGHTGDRRLLDLCEDAWNAGTFIDLTPERCENDERLAMHGVTCAEELKLPMLLYAYTGKQRYLDLALNAERKLARDHMLPDGVPAGAEALAGNENIINSHETCDITDYTWSLIQFLMTTGDAHWADKIERAVFNAGPGAVTKDFKSLQYFSSVNQTIATGRSNHNEFFHGSTWMAYRPIHETECCSGNVHRFMPNYATYSWLRDKDEQDKITAALYGPTTYHFFASDSTECEIQERTLYPFDGEIEFNLKMGKRKKLKFQFRIPEWCSDAKVCINGKSQRLDTRAGGFCTLERKFKNGDKVTLEFEMTPRIERAKDQGIYIMRGPLLYSYSVPHTKTEDTTVYDNMYGKASGNPDFKCWSMVPDGKWNYGLAVSGPEDIETIKSAGRDGGGYPYEEDSAPCRLRVPVKEINWSLQEDRYTPRLPEGGKADPISQETEYIELVPYGSTELRITVFPECRETNPVREKRTVRLAAPLVNPIEGVIESAPAADTVDVAGGENASLN